MKSKEMDSTLNLNELAIEFDYEQNAKEDFYGELNEGDYFGELAILNGQAKSMTAWCLQNTHYITITRKQVEKLQQMVKQRTQYEKIAFLKALPQFKAITQSKLKTMIDQFKQAPKIRGAYLFQEGEPASHIYIIVNGEFKVIKKVHKAKLAFEEDADNIFKDPLKAKRQNSEFRKQTQTKFDYKFLENVTRSQLVGAEDIFSNNTKYTVSVVCESQTGHAIQMSRGDFLKLKSNDVVWKMIASQVTIKLEKYCKLIIQNS